jgi:arginine utilization regulatory protein
MELVQKGLLRKDLYYRLNVIALNIPPLRERKNDIPTLVEHFIKKYNARLKKDVWYLSNDVKEAFLHHDWPGNVRELENLIEGAMNMINNEHIIKSEHFSYEIYHKMFSNIQNTYSINMEENKTLDEILKKIEISLINEALSNYNGNISKSAEKLGIKRQTLQHKMKKYGMLKDE